MRRRREHKLQRDKEQDKEQAERDEYADAAKTGDTQASGNPGTSSSWRTAGTAQGAPSQREVRPKDVVGNARVRESLAPLCTLVCGTNVDSKRNNTAALDDDSQRDGHQ